MSGKKFRMITPKERSAQKEENSLVANQWLITVCLVVVRTLSRWHLMTSRAEPLEDTKVHPVIAAENVNECQFAPAS